MRRRLGIVRRRIEAVVASLAQRRRQREIARTPPIRDRVAVFYGRHRVPRGDEPAHGGTVKLQQLQQEFPNESRAFNLLYLVSSALPPDDADVIRLAHERGAPLVWNQDGVAYAGWHGPGWERVNERLANGLHAAAHVFFQSTFCRIASERFLGARDGPSEVLPNPVDTERFVPGSPEGPITVVLGGNQYQRYRFERAVETLALVRAEHPHARLLVTGRISWLPDRRAAEREASDLLAASGVGEHVELVGEYPQLEAPALLSRGHLLLHTKYNDPCPTTVLEALACGLPVVYSVSGGTPELVGPDAGIGIPAPLDWERDHPPEAAALADAALAVLARRDEFSRAARARALCFDLAPWLRRHREVFQELAG